MSTAWASEAAGAGHVEAFYQTPEFWVFIAFVMLVGASGKLIYSKLTAALDMRADNIREQLEEAAKLREDAQEMLAAFERKQRDAANEAKDITERAKAEAKRLAGHAAEELEKALKRREQLAMERISQAESKALDEVRTLAVEVAINATRELLSEEISAKKAASMVDDAIKDLPEKLN